jgi:hypothetical protein
MRFIRSWLTLAFAAASDSVNSMTNVHEFMVEFREYLQARRVPVVSGTETCEELWRDHSPDRVYLYRMASKLGVLQYRIDMEVEYEWDSGLDSSVIPSVEFMMETMGTELEEMARVVDAGVPDDLDYDDFYYPFSDGRRVRLINQASAITRLAQDPDHAKVPLFETNADFGFPAILTYEKLESLIQSLVGVRGVCTASDVPQDEKRTDLSEIMEAVHDIVELLYRAPAHDTGEELPQCPHPWGRSSAMFPRECRLAHDPLAGIERIATDLIGSIDFCRGLLFRFVSRETRDEWIESLYELGLGLGLGILRRFPVASLHV